MTELISKDIVDLQDIEKVQFLQTLQSDPAKFQAYVNEKTGAIMNEVVDTKRAAFVKVAGDMARTMDMDHYSQAALLRTHDLAETQGYIVKEQDRLLGSKRYEQDTTRRQVEINNWYYENKRETLFVLQLVLLVMLTLVIVIGVASYGWITQTGADYLMVFVVVVGAGTWLYRWYYTRNIRDPRYWNQRRFEDDGKVGPPDVPHCATASGEVVPVAVKA
jgi:hypothetical protein